MPSTTIHDVIVIGGGAVGLSAAYEVAKAGKSVIVLEKGSFFNQAGSSGDLVRMFRTMYTEDFMADLAHDAIQIWEQFERDAGDDSVRLMSGLLNFGNPDYGADGPEGTLKGPIPNMQRLGMAYKTLTKNEIELSYPFKNLPQNYEGLFSPDCGLINVPLLLRTLYRLAHDYGARLHQNNTVSGVDPVTIEGRQLWAVIARKSDNREVTYITEKIIITSGAYTNHVLTPSFNIHLELDIWEMVASYFSVNSGPQGTVFPSMWFQFEEDKQGRSQLFYGFPALPWGPPNLARIACDSATRRITDPNQRHSSQISSEDIKNTQDFIQASVVGVDGSVPGSSFTCLQTNVFDNMFVLDFLPEKYLRGGVKDSISIFTAGWAMKFVPLLGRALKDMTLHGSSKYKLEEFSIERTDPVTHKGIIGKGPVPAAVNQLRSASTLKAAGSSFRS